MSPATRTSAAGVGAEVVRVREDPGCRPGEYRVLADLIWIRRAQRAALEVDEWAMAVAPSTEIRRWYGDEPDRSRELARRSRTELDLEPGAPVVDRRWPLAGGRGRLVVLTASSDVEHLGAAVPVYVLRTGSGG